MRKRIILGAAGLALTATTAFAAVSLAGGGAAGEARDAAPTVVAKPSVAREAGAVIRAGGGATIQSFYFAAATVPPEGGGAVQGARCPRRAGKPISGGASTSEGIVISYLSRIDPESNDTRPSTYYVGVDDNSTTNAAGSGAIIEVSCAKGLEVKG